MATADDELNSLGMIAQSPGHFAFAANVTALAAGALAVGCWQAGWIVAVLMDGYLALLIWVAVCKSSGRAKSLIDLPNRGPALWILVLALTCLVTATAATYPEGAHGVPRLRAVYASFISIASFSFNTSDASDYLDTDTPDTPALTQALQLVSGILLLMTAFPILLSRISEWDSSSEHPSVLFNGVLIQLPRGSNEKAVVMGNTFMWSGHALTVVAALPGVVTYKYLNQVRRVLSQGAVIKLNADGTCGC